MGACLNGIQKVRGSIPLVSTKIHKKTLFSVLPLETAFDEALLRLW